MASVVRRVRAGVDDDHAVPPGGQQTVDQRGRGEAHPERWAAADAVRRGQRHLPRLRVGTGRYALGHRDRGGAVRAAHAITTAAGPPRPVARGPAAKGGGAGGRPPGPRTPPRLGTALRRRMKGETHTAYEGWQTGCTRSQR